MGGKYLATEEYRAKKSGIPVELNTIKDVIKKVTNNNQLSWLKTNIAIYELSEDKGAIVILDNLSSQLTKLVGNRWKDDEKINLKKDDITIFKKAIDAFQKGFEASKMACDVARGEYDSRVATSSMIYANDVLGMLKPLVVDAKKHIADMSKDKSNVG